MRLACGGVIATVLVAGCCEGGWDEDWEDDGGWWEDHDEDDDRAGPPAQDPAGGDGGSVEPPDEEPADDCDDPASTGAFHLSVDHAPPCWLGITTLAGSGDADPGAVSAVVFERDVEVLDLLEVSGGELAVLIEVAEGAPAGEVEVFVELEDGSAAIVSTPFTIDPPSEDCDCG